MHVLHILLHIILHIHNMHIMHIIAHIIHIILHISLHIVHIEFYCIFLFLFPHMHDFPPLTAVFKFTEIVENDNQVQQKQKYIA